MTRQRGSMRPILELSRQIENSPGRVREILAAFAAGHTFPLADDDTAVFFYWGREPVDAVYLLHWVFGLESRQPFLRLQ